MRISKNYQKALEICNECKEFEIIEYLGGKSPKLKLKCLKCGNIFERYVQHFIKSPYICPKCAPKGSNQYITIEEAQKRIDNVYGENYLKILEYKGNNTLTNIQCQKCGHIFQSVPTSLRRHRTIGCPNCEKTKSLGEKKLQHFFEEKNIHYNCQYRFKDCKDKLMLPFDFYLPQFNICVEFQGEQHYNKNSLLWDPKIEKHDNIKEKFCKDNNIQLIKIPYYDIDKINSYFMFIQE